MSDPSPACCGRATGVLVRRMLATTPAPVIFCATLSSKLQFGCWMGAVMGAKRALIVDDSKSARLFLARILEKYELDVDNAENAESAIEYLATHRPDVIFFDHTMPGI